MVGTKAKGLITLLILTLLLAACSGNSKGEENGGNAASGEEKPYEITMAYLTFGDLPDLSEVQAEINKITMEKINATVKMTPINLSAFQQQTNLMMAGNQKLDLVVTSSAFNYSGQVAKNQLLPLDDLLAAKGQGIIDLIDPSLINATKIDGKTYGVPSMRDLAASTGIVMRKDLVDKHNIDVDAIKTLDDLDAVFKTIKDNEPGVTPLVQGSASQTIAGVLYGGLIDPLGDRFGVLPGFDNGLKVANLFETKEYTDTVQKVRSWYEAGYIAKGVATETETAENLIKAGKGFATFSQMKPGYDMQVSRNTGKEMIAVTLVDPVTTTANITGFMLSISKNSQNIEKSMELMNLLYTDKDIVNLIDNGIEGKHYTKEDDNIIVPVENSGYSFNQWMLGNNYLSYVWKGDSPDLWEQLKTFNDSALKSKALGFSFNAEPVKTELAAVTNAYNQYKVGIDSGMLEPVRAIKDMNAKLKEAGLDIIIAEKQKQLDGWAAEQSK